MKLSIIAFFASLLSFFSCGTGNKTPEISRDVPKSTIKSYTYSEYGTMANPNHQFTVEYVDDEVCKVTYYDTDKYKENQTIECPASLLKDIEAIVNEKKMYNYKNHYESVYDVMDGYSWTLEIKYMNDTTIQSSGSNARPKDGGLSDILTMMLKQIKGI